MEQVSTLLEQIRRLEEQNRNERDPDLRRENKKTIKALHRQARNPWLGISSSALFLLLVFALVLGGVSFLARFVGTWPAILIAGVALAATVVFICVPLLVKGHITEGTFAEIVKSSVSSVVNRISSAGDHSTDKPPEQVETSNKKPQAREAARPAPVIISGDRGLEISASSEEKHRDDPRNS